MDEVKTVLIIDDDEDDLFLIQDKLEEFVNAECEFVTCHVKHQAIDLLKNRTFDLCILDHRLSGYSGIDILKAVERHELSTPIVMLTGQNDDGVAREAIKRGAQDYVMKSSIDKEVFQKSIRYAISRKELEFARSLSHKIQSENLAKDKFIAHLSHELRTPLTSILGYTTLLLENPNATLLSKELNIIQNNGKHLLGLLNDVLDLSKIAAGKFSLREKEADLQQVMVEIISLVSVSAIDKGLQVEFASLTPLPNKVYIDDLRFKQVLVNLIGNAIKFTDTGSVKVSMSMQQHSSSNILEIRIQDTGIGMKSSQIKDIFAPFKQIEDVTDRKAGGAGLGLAITAEIVKYMNGKLRVDSTLNVGSTFTLTIPIVFDKQIFIDYQFDYKDQISTIENVPQFIGRVLVVDDVFEIRQLIGHFVKQTGAQVDYASNGQQAIEKIEAQYKNKKAYDMVLMDLHMPVLTGPQAIKKIKEDYVHAAPAAKIAMTAATQKGLDEELLQLGFDGLITKPIDKQELWRLLSINLPANISGNNKAVSMLDSTPMLVEQTDHICSVHLVEDDNDSAVIMTLLLEGLGCRVTHSDTATQAIENAKSTLDIDFHLIDMGLPDMSGEAMLEKLSTNTYSGKLVILSGIQPSETLLQQYSIHKCLLKPVDKKDLISLITVQ